MRLTNIRKKRFYFIKIAIISCNFILILFRIGILIYILSNVHNLSTPNLIAFLVFLRGSFSVK